MMKIAESLSVMLTEEQKARIISTVETRSVNASLDNYAGEIAEMEAETLAEKGNVGEAGKLRQEAKLKFKEALKYDPTYKRAKENLAKLGLGVPLTL